jgi:hypothetical protein
MEFLDMSLTKDSSLCSMLFTVPSTVYWQILQKPILYSGFKLHTKKSAKQENPSLFVNNIL